MFASAIEKAKSNPQEMLQHGLIGVYAKEKTGRAIGEKPGMFCPKMCPFNISECESCLQEQQMILEQLSELQSQEQEMERISANPSSVMKRTLTNCNFCGAPYEKGNKICLFCDTPYSSHMLIAELPTGKLEQEKYILEQCADIYNQYIIWNTQNRKKEIAMKSKGNEWIAKVQNGFAEASNSMTRMTAEQIKLGAQRYNVGYIDYIAGVMAGEYQTNTYLEMKDYMEAQDRYYDRNMQIERERQEKLRKINQEKNQAMGNLFYSKYTDWAAANGIKDGCWNCSRYNGRTDTCLRTNLPVLKDSCCIYHNK